MVSKADSNRLNKYIIIKQLVLITIFCFTPIFNAYAIEEMIDCHPLSGFNAETGSQITFKPHDIMTISFNETRITKFSGISCNQFLGALVTSDAITIKCKAFENTDYTTEMDIDRNRGTFSHSIRMKDKLIFLINGICERSSRKF